MDWVKAWFWYWLFFWPGCPTLGRIKDADCIYVQAFGRTTYADQALPRLKWLVRESNWTDLDKFADLQRRDFQPGSSNLDLAFVVWQLVYRHHLPVLMQWEVAYSLWVSYPRWYVERGDQLIALWPAGQAGYFSTREVKRLSRDLARAHGWSRPLEVANNWMIARAVLMVAKLEGRLPIVINSDVAETDWTSIQFWTKAWWLWIPREFVSRIVHVLLGWV